MEEGPSKKIGKILLCFVIGVFVIKTAGNAGFFEAKSYKARGYSVNVPQGWKLVKRQKGVVYPQGSDAVMFVPKEVNMEEEPPYAHITIYTKKLSTPIWMEDEFPEILSSIQQEGYKVMDKGQIKLDELDSHWLVYHDVKVPALVLEFYAVTDNNTFYKIQYSSHPDKFNTLRKSFEELRESFKVRFSFY
jgi:hypothetical protein